MVLHNPDDIARSHQWLGHDGYFTELNAIHPAYRHGDRQWNAAHNAYPIVRYAKTTAEVVGFANQYAMTHMVCCGINPRQEPLSNDYGRPRSAREIEITVSQNILFDIDLKSREHLAALEELLQGTKEYFAGRGFLQPATAYTGRGYHLLFAYEPIRVSECPDISARINEFRQEFAQAYRQALAAIDATIDPTFDLRRMTRLYGTAKPEIGIISKFFGNERREDERLREYLLAIPMRQKNTSTYELRIKDNLPTWFSCLLSSDQHLQEIWNGKGKPDGTDTSRSGFDFTITKYLLRHGHHDLDELATIIARRPNGAAMEKGIAYIKRTIANAISK